MTDRGNPHKEWLDSNYRDDGMFGASTYRQAIRDGLRPNDTMIEEAFYGGRGTLPAEVENYRHIMRVAGLLNSFAMTLIERGMKHDASKFDDEEIIPLAEMQRLRESEGEVEFGSAAYEARKRMLGGMLSHHYAANSHHPEHHDDGVNGMTLFDLVEMFMDWKAASERHGAPHMGLNKACDRYEVSRQLQAVMENTARELGWKADAT